MDEITFFLGAGASCKSMPLVANFKDRFEYFISVINSLNFDNKYDFGAICIDFRNAINAHLSFDTYFKKLFHQKQHDLIEKGKALILIYFIFEHLLEVRKRISVSKSPIAEKANNPDPRYEALIAGLLMPVKDKNEFYTQINFITWNYDSNLADAVRSFIYPQQQLYDFICEHKFSANDIKCGDQLKIVHLNGLVNHPLLNRKKEPIESMTDIVRDLANEYFKPESELYKSSKSIAFSWESLHYADAKLHMPPFVEGAREAIKRSGNIIITGYSFPLYNRMVDTYLLNRETLGRKSIYIQDPRADEIREIIEHDLGIYDNSHINRLRAFGIPSIRIKTITNCDSFFVPNNIFLQGQRTHF